MNRDRLTRMRDLLVADAANPKGIKFELATWVRRSRPINDKYTFLFNKGEKPAVGCGTAGCAMGLAMLSGEFEADGLRIKYVHMPGNENAFLIEPLFGDKGNYHAAAALFEISYSEALWLFGPSQYSVTKGAEAELEVARRIDVLLDRAATVDTIPETV